MPDLLCPKSPSESAWPHQESILSSYCDRDNIHVLHLIGSSGLYGAERWILALMRAVDATRINMTLLNLAESASEPSQVVSAAKQRGLTALDFVSSGKINPAGVVRLAGWVRKQQVDIIHGHGFKSDVIGLLTARLAHCKVITTPHGWSMEKDLKLKLYETVQRMTFRFMDMVCPLSPDLEAGLNKWTSKDKLRLIMNGVDLDEMKGVKANARQYPETFQLGYIGQLIERKDLDTLLYATKTLLEGGAKIRLMIIGEGPKKPALQEKTRMLEIEEHVEFMGFRLDAAAYLKTFDAFVLPSHMEGIPRCIMEGMAAGIPVVVSNIPGNRDLVSHKDTGLLFASGNYHDLAEKIAFLMGHPSEAQAMAANAWQKIEEQFSSRNMAREYTALYRQLLGR
jgi:glycosyltransferase involved in cell wall biosynthesis